MMLDRFGRELRIGELVSITNHPELTIKVNWMICDFIDYGVAIDVIVKNFVTNEIKFINLLDIEKEFY